MICGFDSAKGRGSDGALRSQPSTFLCPSKFFLLPSYFISLIKHGLGRDNWRFDVKNRCTSDETDSLVSSRAEESSQTRGAGKRSGTDHRATGFHCAGTMATQHFHAAIFRCD